MPVASAIYDVVTAAVLVLLASTVLGTFKPRGLTRHGQRRGTSVAAPLATHT